MIVESYRPQFLAKIDRRLDLAADDIKRLARANLGGGGGQLSGSVKVEQIGSNRWRVGSNHPGARAQEKGVFIRPKRARVLKFADGAYSMHARVPAKRWLSRAGKQWARAAGRRLRGG